jgi:hypothetical protein
MRKIYLLLFVVCLCINNLYAQEQDNVEEKKYAMTTVDNRLGFSFLTLSDDYLSPLEYKGYGLKLETERRRFFSDEKTNLSHQSKIGFLPAVTQNPAKTATTFYVGLDYAWGVHYHFYPVRKFQILLGGFADIDLGLKLNSRNENNPFNMDLGTNLNASAIFIYDVHKAIRLQASFSTPVLGAMFVPAYGASYYEIFDLGITSKLVHFSSFHNKHEFNQMLSVFFTLKHSILSINVNNNFLKYTANDMVFKRNETTISLGWSHYLRTFAGRKNEAPKNFIRY